jgi:hypothetical protein
MNTKKHIIWTDDIGDINDWRDGLEDAGDLTDEELYLRAIELNDSYLMDEIDNLSSAKLGEPIVAFGDLGLWWGRTNSYQTIYAEDIGEALLRITGNECATGTVYVDSRGDLIVEQKHHDGENIITLREWKPEVSEYRRKNLLKKVYYNTATRADITRCTKALGPAIAKVYGWEA